MRSRILLIIVLITHNYFVYSQISISNSDVDYTLTHENDNIKRILTFWKDKDSTIYTSVKYSISDFNAISTNKNLSEEIIYINQLWNIARDSINFELQSFNIAYPLLYSDVLRNHIQAFLSSNEWQDHIKLNGKKLDYELIKKIMLDYNTYKPLNEFLNSKGYHISGFSTEKHGYVTKKNLQKAGFSENEIVPMPFIVWVILDKVN